MTWNDYKTWLEVNIIEEKTILDEDNIVLREGIATKYSLGNMFGSEIALAKAIENLGLSIENNSDYISSESNSEYHTLPPLTDLMDNDNKVKSWQELFPNRTTTFFGKKEDIETELDTKTWTALGQIFTVWHNEEALVEKLEKELNEDEIAKDFMIKTAIHFNINLLKKGGYEQKLLNWLKEYNKLGQEKQEQLKEKKELTERLLAHLREELQLQGEQASKSWYQNIPWTSVIWYGCGILAIILVFGWLKSKMKEK